MFELIVQDRRYSGGARIIYIAVIAALSIGPAAPSVLGAFGDELIKLTASDAGEGDRFGWSAATDGSTAIVGALLDYPGGSAYLFDASTGNERMTLRASDGAEGDEFGRSVAISDNMAIVGSPRDDDDGEDSGSAYLFNVETGQELFKISASDLAEGDEFGWSVAISGDTAIIGANSDSAYIFDVATGEERLKLQASDDIAAYFDFGNSVAISGNTAIIGAPNAGIGLARPAGAAYLFDVATGEELAKLVASDAEEDGVFGFSVAISGNIAIVGDYNADQGRTGSAYLFDVTTGEELFKLSASDASTAAWFGRSVAISGNLALVGAHYPFNDIETGAAYLFDVRTGEELAKLTASDAAGGDLFGGAVAIAGAAALVGANGNDDAGSNSGSVYVFSLVPEPTTDSLLLAGLLGIPHFRWRR